MKHRDTNGIRTFCWGLLVFALSCSPSRLEAEDTAEYDVKAAFLLNFARFVDWPDSSFTSSRAPLEICILGRDPFGRLLTDIVRGEIVQDRAIVVRRITAPPKPQTCQMLFVSTGGASIRSGIPAGVLIVSDDARHLNSGAMLAFILDARRVRFDVNQKAAENAGLKISSKLLSVARMVIQ